MLAKSAQLILPAYRADGEHDLEHLPHWSLRSYSPLGINLLSSMEDNLPCHIITLGIHSAAVHLKYGVV